ncbi:MAG: hypothetical protein LQ339_004983 [Xanthoria mediterranea]|nr:MAG: hypothetical protein LQ339_004983 [Xanthoria mediterranea]
MGPRAAECRAVPTADLQALKAQPKKPSTLDYRPPARSNAMSSNTSPAPGQPAGTLRPNPAQPPIFQQFSSPPNSVIDESPISPPDAYQAFEKPPVERTGPHETHPAYFAPVAEHSDRQQPGPQQPAPQQPNITSGTATDPKKAREPVDPSTPTPTSGADAQQWKGNATVIRPDVEKPALMYNPNSLAGPNATLENHRPGQAAHPNTAVEPDWKHGLCEVDTLCCVGLCCPCIVYGKTQYRISRKTQKEDATNLLGYKTFNGSCGLMGLACGFQWVLASIQRARVRKLYSIKGDFASDCLKSLCCCCCVIMQDEREVRDREELIRRHAGPASAAYASPPTMTYAPPPR